MQQAVYSPDNVGHFGLAYESYTHFTSPIRRYPDLLVHRAIKAVLDDKKYKAGDWAALGMHCSMTERRADDATRDVTSWLKCYYMQDKIGESFEGSVSGVTGFGLFVALDGVYIEGLLHVTELGNDYFHFDNVRHVMSGERTGNAYRLGDRLRVKVARVDMESSKIDFVLDDEPEAEAEAKPAGRKVQVKSAPKKAAVTAKPAASKAATKPAAKPKTARKPSTRNKASEKPQAGAKGKSRK